MSALARDHFAASARSSQFCWVSRAGRDIHLLQLRAVAEIRADFRLENVVRVVVQPVRLLCVNDAVQHQRIERIQIAPADDFVMNVVVLVGNPALALGRGAGNERMILAAAPDRIRIQQPERRRPGAGGLVDVNVRLERAQFADQLAASRRNRAGRRRVSSPLSTPMPSNLNWLMPYFFTTSTHSERKRS